MILVIIIGIVLYFLPAIIALAGHKNKTWQSFGQDGQ
jgi:hypothetical protein